MNKSNKTQEKREYLKYPSSKAYNLLSPPYNPKQKSKAYLNTNIPKNKPINLYSTYLSPFQSEKNLFVKNINSPDDKISQNLMNKFSQFQKNNNSKIIGSPNTTNSDLLTAASLTSNESILSNNTSNTSIFIPLNVNVQPTINNFDLCEFNKGHRYNYSMINPQINMNNNFYNMNTLYINGNYSNINNNYIKGKQGFFNQNVNTYMTNNTSIINNSGNNCLKNKKNKNKNNNNNGDKKNLNMNMNMNNYNSNNSSKSKSNSDSNNTDSCKLSSNKSNSNTSIKKGKLYTNPKRKNHFNKFNTTKENNTNENTVILTLEIKVAKNDYRTFNLKKYDDLFISLEKFFDYNKIEQSLVKPIVTKIFEALNKIFWLFNSKIGKYDSDYLDSLNKLWIKNNKNFPKKEENKDNKSKDDSNKSTISSSDSTDENKKHNKVLSNSFQNMDSSISSDDEKQKTVKSI